MTVLKLEEIVKVERDFWGEAEDLDVCKSAWEFTLACDWPGCDTIFISIQQPGFLRDAGWRYCGTRRQHLCPIHSSYSDDELKAVEEGGHACTKV